MNHIVNDRGESVIATGAPGSVARVRCEYPELIQKIGVPEGKSPGGLPAESATVLAEQLFRRGITSPLESESLLTAANFSEPVRKQVLAQFGLVVQDHDRDLRAHIMPAPKPGGPAQKVEPQGP